MRIKAGTTTTGDASTLELPSDWALTDAGDGHVQAAIGGSGTAVLSNWYRKLASDPANAKLVFLGDSTSYEPNDQRLFCRFRPNVTTTNGSHTLPVGTITVASTSGFPAAGTAVVGGQSVAYTGTTATTLTGCTGGSGVIATGSKVVSPQTLDTVHTAPGGDLYGMTADDSHIINGGNNGVKLVDWLAGSGTYTFANLVADAPDLIIFDWGINDVRVAVDTYTWQTLAALLTTAINRIRAALPSSDIILRIAGPASTDNVSSLNHITAASGAVNPAGGAQAFTDTMRKAYRSLMNKWPNVVVWDSQLRVFGEKAIASTNTNLWSTQIHPSAFGYALTADYLVNDCIAPPGTGRRIPQLAPLQDVGFPVGDGIATTTATPYTVDQEALDNTNIFQLVYAGEYNAQTATTLLVGNSNNAIDWPYGYPLDVQIGDVVRLPDGVCYKLTVSGSTQASGTSIQNLFLTGQSIPANTVVNGIVRVYRELSQGDRLLAKIRSSPGANRWVRIGRVQSGSTNFAVVTPEPQTTSATPSGLWGVTTTDSFYVAGGGANPVALTNYNFIFNGANLQLSGTTIDFTNLVGRIIVFVGSHAPELVGSSLVVGVTSVSATYTAKPGDKVILATAGSAFSVTLPTAVNRKGQTYTIKKVDASANAVTIATTSAQTIDGAASGSLAVQWKYMTVVSDNANWLIVANN